MKADGVDVEINYTADLDALNSSLDGRLSLRALATYVSKLNSTTKGSPTIDRAGSTPMQMTLRADYLLGSFDAALQGRMIGARDIDTTYTTSRIAATDSPPL
jgi:iron complex outermembrane recepter protein